MQKGKQVQKPWWERADLRYQHGRLFFGNQDLVALAQSAETPVYAYSAARIKENFNLQNLAVYYNIPFEVVPLTLDDTAPKQKVTVAGNINEAIDLFAEDILLLPVAEGDWLGLLNVGGYGSAGSSNHCMQGTFSEYLLVDR